MPAASNLVLKAAVAATASLALLATPVGRAAGQSGQGLLPERLPIERLMREFQVRHRLAFPNEKYIQWPMPCCGSGELPTAYPEDGLYGDLARDPRWVTEQLEKMRLWLYVDHFAGPSPLYIRFIDSDDLNDGMNELEVFENERDTPPPTFDGNDFPTLISSIDPALLLDRKETGGAVTKGQFRLLEEEILRLNSVWKAPKKFLARSASSSLNFVDQCFDSIYDPDTNEIVYQTPEGPYIVRGGSWCEQYQDFQGIIEIHMTLADVGQFGECVALGVYDPAVSVSLGVNGADFQSTAGFEGVSPGKGYAEGYYLFDQTEYVKYGEDYSVQLFVQAEASIYHGVPVPAAGTAVPNPGTPHPFNQGELPTYDYDAQTDTYRWNWIEVGFSEDGTSKNAYVSPLLGSPHPQWPSCDEVDAHRTGPIAGARYGYTIPYEGVLLTVVSVPDGEDADCPPCGGETAYCPVTSPGWPHVRVPLGSMSPERGVGLASMGFGEPSSGMSSPSGWSEAVWNDITVRRSGAGVFRGVTAAAQVVTLGGTADSSTVSFYRANAQGDLPGWNASAEAFDTAGFTAYRTVSVEELASAADPEVIDRVLVSQTFVDPGGASRTTRDVFVWDDVDMYWTLYRAVQGDGQGGWDLSSAEQVERERGVSDTQDVGGEQLALRGEVDEVLEPGTGAVVSRAESWYHAYPWGEERARRVTGVGADTATETWLYYDDEAADGALYRKKKAYLDADTGHWEVYDRDASGRPRVIRPKDGAAWSAPADQAARDALAAANVATVTEQTVVDLDDPGADVEVVEVAKVLVGGVVVQTTYDVSWNVNTAGLWESWRIACVEPDPEATTSRVDLLNAAYAGTAAGVLVTKTWRHSSGTHEYEVAKSQSPDGTWTIHEHPTSTQSVVSRGRSDLADVTDRDDLTYGTITTTETDAEGNVLWTRRERVDGAAWFAESLERVRTRDDFGRPLLLDYFYGAGAVGGGTGVPAYTTETVYECCGIDTVTDRRGVVTDYGYDALGRTERTTTMDGSMNDYAETRRVYDAAGRVVERWRARAASADANTPGDWLIDKTVYDLGGRASARSTPSGVGGDAYDQWGFTTERRVLASDGVTAYDPSSHAGQAFYTETRVYPHADSTSGSWTAPPISVAWTDAQGRTVRRFLATTGEAWDGDGFDGTPASYPAIGDGAFTEALTRETMRYDALGRLVEQRSYHGFAGMSTTDLTDPGVEGTNYHATRYAYDGLGRRIATEGPMGDVTASVYGTSGGETGRVVSTWTAVNDGAPGALFAGLDGVTAPASPFVRVAETYYDADFDRDPAEADFRDYPTRQTVLRPTTGVAYRDVDHEQSYAVASGGLDQRIVWSKPRSATAGLWTKQVYDDQGRMIASESYVNGSTADLVARTTRQHDPATGRLLSTTVHGVDPATHTQTPDALVTAYGYDAVGRQHRVRAPAGLITRTAYDALGRVERTWTASDDAGTDDPGDDLVLTETAYLYDDAGNVTQTFFYDRVHGDTATTGLLSADANLARVTQTAAWYDRANRPTHQAQVATPNP